MLNLLPLTKALSTLERSLKQPKNEFTRNSTVQCFEFSYELCWKALKRYFGENQNLDESNIKNLFRIAGKQALIESVETWFEYQKIRNLTAPTYNEDTAELVYGKTKLFYQDAIKLLRKSGELND